MQPKTIICIGGYARSGKTTTIEILESLGVPVFSASRFLHQVVEQAEKALWNPFELYDDVMTDRAKCICMAEEILIPVFGRKLFAHAMYDGAISTPEETVAIETIGGQEFQEFKMLARGHRLECWNVRSEREKSGVDIRQLLPEGQDIWNDGTIADWQKQIEDRVYLLRGGTN